MAMSRPGPTDLNRLRAVREAFGISQAELARRMRLDQSLVSRAERGLIATWPRFRRTASEALGVDETRLFGDQ
jgi:transcriptional regulator with XRE-family HTH domain